VSTASGGWSGYFAGLVHDLGIHIPAAWSQAPCTFACTVFESMGTLLAFAMIAAGTTYLRIRHLELPRAFKTPVRWLAAPLGTASWVYLIASLPVATFWRSLT
jgi:amino acid transporter